MAAKYRQIADNLSERIRRGQIGNGSRLPGELELAELYEVSRSTVRQALSCLQQAGLIETWTGAGSFVRYDDAILDDRVGWTKALAVQGVETRTRVLRLERIVDAPLAEQLGTAAGFLALDRVRSLASGAAISLERSRLPWCAAYTEVLHQGLVEGSLQRTLEKHGLAAVSGIEDVGLAQLTPDEAALLGRSPGEAFLATRRVSHDTGGDVVECVDSLLDPAHFKLQFLFGRPQ
ncbi:MAG: GntR family transcriptional regulator [Alphaproteobacteria bacterium]